MQWSILKVSFPLNQLLRSTLLAWSLKTLGMSPQHRRWAPPWARPAAAVVQIVQVLLEKHVLLVVKIPRASQAHSPSHFLHPTPHDLQAAWCAKPANEWSSDQLQRKTSPTPDLERIRSRWGTKLEIFVSDETPQRNARQHHWNFATWPPAGMGSLSAVACSLVVLHLPTRTETVYCSTCHGLQQQSARRPRVALASPRASLHRCEDPSRNWLAVSMDSLTWWRSRVLRSPPLARCWPLEQTRRTIHQTPSPASLLTDAARFASPAVELPQHMMV